MDPGKPIPTVASFPSALSFCVLGSRTLFSRTLWICLTLTLYCCPTFALDPNQPLSQLHHTSWNARQGVSGNVTALRKANGDRPLHAVAEEHAFTVRENTDWRNARNEVAEEYAKRQREEIVRTLSACKGRVGGADGAAARMVMNRTTLLSRMKKFGIYAKEYA